MACNSNKSRVHLHYDGFHVNRERVYCGVRVGQEGYHNPCGRCDGRCGPTNGCQCTSCYALDKEIEHRKHILGVTSLENSEGCQLNVSFSAPNHDNFSSAYRFYCGRYVGRENYVNRCQRCDGTCGPDNGCQCRSCFEMESLFHALCQGESESSESGARNSRGDRIRTRTDLTHGSEPRSYCCRRVGRSGYQSDCGRCDGVCGPDNGCQCRACYALDAEIKRRKQKLRVQSFVNDRNDRMHVSFCDRVEHGPVGDYRFYCGRQIGKGNYSNRCSRCDGRCGPSNGCQCPACFSKEQQLQLEPSQVTTVFSNLTLDKAPQKTLTRKNKSSDTHQKGEERLTDRISKLQSIAECDEMEKNLESLQNQLKAKKEELLSKANGTETEKSVCVVCLDQPKCVLLLPCKHLCLCGACSELIPRLKACPLCNVRIESHMKIFL